MWACWSPCHCCAYPYCPFKVFQHVHAIPVCTMKSCTNESFTKCFHQWTNLLFSAQVDKLKPVLDTTVVTHDYNHDRADVMGSLLDGQCVPAPGLCSSAALLAVQPCLFPSTAWICAAGVEPGRWCIACAIVANSARSLPSRCVPVGEVGNWLAWQADPAYKHRAGWGYL